MNQKVIVATVLSLSTVIFLVGVIIFATVEFQNRGERDNLLKNGFRTDAVVLSKDVEVTRKVNQESMRWQYFDNYYLTFSYSQDTIKEGKFAVSLKDYLNRTEEKKTVSISTEMIEITSPVDKLYYQKVRTSAKIPIVFLAGNPSSARILNSEGGVMIPKLYIFCIISLLLFLSSAYMLHFYLKTGRTF